jgi:hypothetical protein
MSKLIKRLKESTIDRLHNLVQDTEEIFLHIGQSYPTLIREMNSNIEKAAKSLENLSGSQGSIIQNVNSVLEHADNMLTKTSNRFDSLHKMDKEMTSNLFSSINTLNSLHEYSQKIKDDSEEMELISLNAMTVAVKAGKAGGAFSYITEELKRISERTIFFTEELTRTTEEVNSFFGELSNHAQNLSEFQNHLFNDFGSKLKDSFRSFKDELLNTIQVLENIITDSALIKEPLLQLMQEVQHQDIIRQSVDHVISSLHKLTDIQESDVDVLDKLKFLELLPDLSSSVLDEVGERIEQNLMVFEANTSAIEEILTQSEHRRKEIVQNTSTGETILDKAFRDASELVDLMHQDMQQHIQLKISTMQKTREVTRELKRMAKGFKAFAALISRFHNITIASRIEVVKQEVLSGMEATVEEMFGLTSDIENQMDIALTTITDLSKKTSSNVKLSEELSSEEREFVDQFLENLQNTYRRLSGIRETAMDSILNFSIFTEKFIRMFTESRKYLERLLLLREEFQEITAFLDQVKEEAQREMKLQLDERNLESWDVQNSELLEIINNFTILDHKKKASEITGVEVETDASESGEVTFF